MVDPALSQTYLDRLQKALSERGLQAGVHAPALVAKNAAVIGTDAQRGAPTPAPAYQPLCPADDITTVTARIANIIHVQDPEPKDLPDA